jgi:hypothetical protein
VYNIIEVKKQTANGISTTVSTTDLMAVLAELRSIYDERLNSPEYVKETVEKQIEGIDNTRKAITSQVKGN